MWNTSKSLSKELSSFVSLPNGAKENSKCPIMMPMRVSQATKLFVFLKIIWCDNEASLVYVLVTFYGKLVCSFLTVAMSFLY